MTTRARVLEALGAVYDELDEPITSLGFVTSCEVSDGGEVDVRLRLPTPNARRISPTSWSPTHAMLAGSRRERRDGGARGPLHGGRDQRRRGTRRGFAEAFPGETEGELDALRDLFRRKALVARQSRGCARRC